MPIRSLTARLFTGLLSLAFAAALPALRPDALAGSAQTGGPSRDPGLLEGIRLVDEGDLSGAVIALDSVVRRLATEGHSGPDLAAAYLYKGIAEIGLEQSERARESFRLARLADPALRLDPRRFSPRVIQAFAEANPETDARAIPSPASTPTPSPTPARDAARKKGGSRGLLIGGGVLVAGGGAAVALGGGSPTPSSTTTPSRAPQLVLAQSSQIPAPGNGVVNFHFWNFSIPGPGQVQYTANWTSNTAEFRLYIAGNPCSDAAPLATTTVTAKPATLNYAASSAGSYCVGIVYQKGDAPESYSLQVVYTPQ